MRNKMVDLKNHLFTALERLNDESLSEEELRTEIERAKAISDIGKVIVDGAKTSLLHAKMTGRLNELEDEFADDKKVKKLTA